MVDSRPDGVRLTEVLDGVGPQVLCDADGEIIGSGEDLPFVLILIIVLILVKVIYLLSCLDGLASRLDLLGSLDVLSLGDLATPVSKPGEEAQRIETRVVDLRLELLLGGSLLGLASSLLLVDGLDEAKHAVGKILTGLPLDLDRLGDEASPLVVGVAPPELLLEDLVLKELVLAELPPDGDAARVTGGELEALDGQVGQVVEKQVGVGGLDVLVNIRGRLLNGEGPEAGDSGNDLVALCVERLAQFVLVADCEPC